MDRTWTRIGANYSATPEQRQRLAELFDRLNWQESGEGVFLPGVLLDIILQFGFCRCSHFAVSHAMRPNSLYGICNQYTNGHADFYVCVAGCSGITVCYDSFPTR